MTKYLLAALSFALLGVSALFISNADASSVTPPAAISNTSSLKTEVSTPAVDNGSGMQKSSELNENAAMTADDAAIPSNNSSVTSADTDCVAKGTCPKGTSSTTTKAETGKHGLPTHGLNTTPAAGKPLPTTVPTAKQEAE